MSQNFPEALREDAKSSVNTTNVSAEICPWQLWSEQENVIARAKLLGAILRIDKATPHAALPVKCWKFRFSHLIWFRMTLVSLLQDFILNHLEQFEVARGNVMKGTSVPSF
jgi:hypothetical protein